MKKSREEIVAELTVSFPLYAGMASSAYKKNGKIDDVTELYKKHLERVLTEAGL